MNQRHVHRACALLAAIFWTLAVAVVGFALDGAPTDLAEVGILLALVACVPTAHLVIEYTVTRSRAALLTELDEIIGRHRRRLVETVLEVVGREDAERRLPRIGDQR